MNRARTLAVPIVLALLPVFTGAASPIADELPPAVSVLALRQEIEEGYYRRSTGTIESAINALDRLAGDPAQGRQAAYYAAFGRLRQALLAGSDSNQAKAYLNDCISRLEDMLRVDDAFAEAQALLASCYGTSSRHYLLRAASRGLAAGRHMDRARQLAPDNPWVVLQDGISDFETPGLFGGDKERAREKLERAVDLFAASRQAGETAPAFGEAEAWLYLGRTYRALGRPADARRALEQARAMAPANPDVTGELAALAADGTGETG